MKKKATRKPARAAKLITKKPTKPAAAMARKADPAEFVAKFPKKPAAVEFHPDSHLLPRMTESEFAALKDNIARNGQQIPIVLHEGKILDGRHRYQACVELGIEPTFVTFSGKGDPAELVYASALHRNLTDSQKAAAAVKLKKRLNQDGQGKKLANLKPIAAALKSAKPITPDDYNALAAIRAFDLQQRTYAHLNKNFGPGTITRLVKDGYLIELRNDLAGKLDLTGQATALLSKPATEGPPVGHQGGRSADIAASFFGVSGAYVEAAAMLEAKDPALFERVFSGDIVITKAVREYRRGEKKKALEKNAAASRSKAGPASDSWNIVTADINDTSLQLPDVRPRLIFCDPPYNEGLDYGFGRESDSLTPVQFELWCMEWIDRSARMLADDGSIFVMMNGRYQAMIHGLLAGVGLEWRNTIVWHETFGNYTDGNFTSCARFVHYFTKHKSRFHFDGDAIRIPSARQLDYGDSRANPLGKVPGNVWSEFPRIVDNSPERLPDFETQIPQLLVERIVRATTEPGDLVADWFTGSGTTAAAAVRLGRRFLGTERNPDRAKQARLRLTTVVPEDVPGPRAPDAAA